MILFNKVGSTHVSFSVGEYFKSNLLISDLFPNEELPEVAQGVASSCRSSIMESQEEYCGDPGGAPWSSKFCTGLLPAIWSNLSWSSPSCIVLCCENWI